MKGWKKRQMGSQKEPTAEQRRNQGLKGSRRVSPFEEAQKLLMGTVGQQEHPLYLVEQVVMVFDRRYQDSAEQMRRLSAVMTTVLAWPSPEPR